MGNNDSQPQNFQILKRQNWIQAGQDQQKILFSNVNPFRKRLLANIITHQLIEEYELNFIAQEDYNNYVKQLNFRKEDIKKYDNNDQRKNINIETNKYIYPIRYFVNKSKKQLCTTVYTGLLYIDKVDLRLKQINDIPFDDLIYMYKATLEGFKYLYEKVGYFDIQEEMIFINRKGQVKVWMNSNLSKNYPNFQKTESLTNKSKQGSECVYGSQAQMIKDLIQLIEKNSDQNEQTHPPFFSQYLSQRNLLQRLSFDYCLQQFHRYLHQCNIFIFDHMRSITELFNPDQINITARTNYQQSHVNQITNAHINQIKKKFHPMQTIVQNDNFTTVSNQKSYHNPNKQRSSQQNNLHTSSVSNYSNKKFQKNQNYLSYNQLKGVVRPGYSKEFHNSQLSYHNGQNKKIHQESNLVNPINFNNGPHFLSHNNDRTLIHPIEQHQIFHQNFIPHHQRGTYINNFPSHQPQYQPDGIKIIPLIKGQTRRVFFNTPQSSYRMMNNLNNQNNRKIVYHIPPQQQTVSPQHLTHLFQQKIIQKPFLTQFPSQQNSIKNFKRQSQSSNEGKTVSYNKSENNNNKNNSVKKQQPNQKLTKSNIKYHSIKQTYQLDSEIAYDLEKFLGLKVN